MTEFNPLFSHVSTQDWQDWNWQLKNRITDLESLKEIINLTDKEEEGIQQALKTLRMAITPYYASLMDKDDPSCPIRRQAVPSSLELNFGDSDLEDPLSEDTDSPVEGITHRYPDRVLFLVTDQCSMYCRHCTRRRIAGTTDKAAPKEVVDNAIEYIKNTPRVRDVLISGGDGLIISDERLEYILDQLYKIEHVEIIRIGTRAPVVLPQRITDDLVSILKKYHPVWLNTHYNHPKELTSEAQKALAKLADAGIPLGNQSVLLKGINDCPGTMKNLVHELVKHRVRPYYIYQCDLSQGIEHFRTSVSAGLEIVEHLRGHTSGFAVPTYVVDAPGGGGKIPVMPQYLISQSPESVILRNYEGVIAKYSEPQDKSRGCGKQSCNDCQLSDNTATGVTALMEDKEISLEPRNLARRQRRKK
ncbi:lysine 2,3-aminomutase [Natranaerobius thermophilus]|uniref:L-lysine 2,3-aminomutase n=1 Tax=Natranaerobius thermophilus (strain ATCC BAA-1301 / DSM 18059 / JW/NM-WN-LF) TaxID=457570 RepID=B2A3K4_NATTJ|nr:lysine 2,3-aminomutase [Natranaerobius thermophilus]ACB86433.1 L-lysine 2,3-aminomutase [Natranaerobius thermophilus JW/NM-WN-LF]